jgi:ABC-type multidrug transport system fused ATPase/permease subunit
MDSWWRVLRGLWPYRWGVALSIVCAVGVGLSYASGVAVMLPVMKIFTSTEGVHGWINRSAAQERFNLEFFSLDDTVRSVFKPTKGEALPNAKAPAEAVAPAEPAEPADQVALVVMGSSAQTVGSLATAEVGDKVTYVRNLTPVGDEAGGSANWARMVEILAHAHEGSTLQLTVERTGKPTETLSVTAPATNLKMRAALAVEVWLPRDSFQSLEWVVVFFIVLCIVGSVFRYYQQFLGMTIANRVVMDLRRRLYDRVVQLPTGYFAQRGTSDVMSRLTQDTSTLTDGLTMAMGKAIQEPIKAAGAFALALWIDWRLCLGVVIVLPVLGLIIRKFSKRMRRASRGALESWSRMLAIINETLIGARVVKAYTAEGYERRRFARINKALLQEQVRLNHYAALSRPTIETLAVILASIPMLAAAYLVLHTMLDKEMFFLLLACFAAMLEPMRKLADVNSKLQQTNAAATRVFEVIDLPPEETGIKHELPRLPRHQRTVEFRHVSFSYPGSDELVLKDVSVTVRAGQTVAVVGGNGSGKTTLLSLLPRLYPPTDGEILIDDYDISAVSLRSLRKQIGLVTQDTLLFADTIFNNIAYGSRHCTRAEVVDAAKRAFADEFIASMPEGYETMVGEHGVRLSGGQKQRIAIARAILHDPSIFILDEAMSQIDSDSEMKIALALREFTRGRTTFMIAHRFSTVISADSIIVLEAGQLVGVGIHTELMSRCPPYRKLYETQFRDMGEIEADAAAPVGR